MASVSPQIKPWKVDWSKYNQSFLTMELIAELGKQTVEAVSWVDRIVLIIKAATLGILYRMWKGLRSDQMLRDKQKYEADQDAQDQHNVNDQHDVNG